MPSIQNLTHAYGNHPVFDNLNFSIPQGGIYGLLGNNGAGKTTLLRMISTTLRPQAGDIQMHGKSIFQDPVKHRSRIGVVNGGMTLYDQSTPRSFLHFFGHFHGLNPKQVDRRIEELKTSSEAQVVAVHRLEHLTPEERKSLESGNGGGTPFQFVAIPDTRTETLRKHPVALSLSGPLDQTGTQVKLYFNSTNQKSALIGSNLKQALERLKVQLVYQKVQQHTPALQGNPAFDLFFQDTASNREKNNGLLFFLILVFLIQFIIIGGQAAAIDTLAGEREKGTFENLLSAPTPIQTVLQAKLLTVVAISLISSLCVFAGLYLSKLLTLTVLPEVLSHMKGLQGSYAELFGQGIQLDVAGSLMVALILFSFALISSAVQYHISMTSRSVKEAQSRVAPIGIVIASSALVIQFSDYFQTHTLLYFTPVINNMLVIIDILKNQMSVLHVLQNAHHLSKPLSLTFHLLQPKRE